ncbi:MAG: signal peptidase II [Planctomycetaceae bacterium]|nr:signal peptidase II [Planctomycetaceae bacterium]
MERSRPAIWTRIRWRPLVLAIVLVSCVGCDQATKRYAVENLKGAPPQSYWGDTLRIQYAENHGAFLSLGANWTPGTRFLVFTVLTGLVLPVVAMMILFRGDTDPWFAAALALILAGGVGNLIDRMTTDEAVVIDFLNLGIGWLRTGVFNVADMAITAGFLMLLPHVFRKEPEPALATEP